MLYIIEWLVIGALIITGGKRGLHTGVPAGLPCSLAKRAALSTRDHAAFPFCSVRLLCCMDRAGRQPAHLQDLALGVSCSCLAAQLAPALPKIVHDPPALDQLLGWHLALRHAPASMCLRQQCRSPVCLSPWRPLTALSAESATIFIAAGSTGTHSGCTLPWQALSCWS